MQSTYLGVFPVCERVIVIVVARRLDEGLPSHNTEADSRGPNRLSTAAQFEPTRTIWIDDDRKDLGSEVMWFGHVDVG